MRNRALHEKLYIVGGGMALGGVGLVLSILFAGAGVVVLFLALLTLLAGLVAELLASQFQRSREEVGPAATETGAGPER